MPLIDVCANTVGLLPSVNGVDRCVNNVTGSSCFQVQSLAISDEAGLIKCHDFVGDPMT